MKPMTSSSQSVQLFLRRFSGLAVLILLMASGFWLLEQHGHQQLLDDIDSTISPGQGQQLLSRFNTHQFESIGAAVFVALLVSALMAWYDTRNRLRQLQTEQENREQLHKIELLLNSTVEGIYAVDLQGCCIMANRSCAGLLGYDQPEDLLGQSMHSLIHHTRPDGSPYPQHECRAHQVIETGTATSIQDEVFWRRDGSQLPVAYTSHPIRDEQQIIGMVCTFSDLTAQRQAEARLSSVEDQLRQAQKMEAIGQLASGVAHDFNNILQVISGNTQLLQLSDPPDPKMLQSRLAEIINSVERGASLTRAMLAFARRQAIVFRPVDLQQLLLETEPLARNLLHKQQRLLLQLHPSPLVVTSDRTLLQQVIFNLITNARDAMPEDGTVTIGMAQVEQPPEQLAAVSQQAPAPFALLWVKDTGHGISQEIRDKVFEPFFSTKDVGKGTGLGLSMVYGTVKQHNGLVWIDSEPGQGTTVSIYLPCSSGAVAAS